MCVYLIISHSVLVQMRNVSDESCRENRNAHFVFSNFFSKIHAVYEKMWKKQGKARQARDDGMMHVLCMLDN